ncbi:DUF4349 domain-containing protein [Sphaerisporangium flaviroseum]|uniref:DUF4349 domain-containing protein n=2 Tax=Sphaerisporangium flaviroseum TaxID=509199 RepID=A0ABP7HKG0_9ACTN
MAAMAAVVLVVSGCGGGADTQSNSGAAPAARPADLGPAAPDQAGKEGGASEGQDSRATTADSSNVKIPDRAIVYTGEMTVRATDVAASAEKAKQIVTGAGGRLDREESSSYGGEGKSTLVFKIPPERYPAVVGQLGKDLGKRESLSQGTEDVTEQVADVESRVKSGEAALDQLRTLLSKAKTIGEVLSVEREISGREAELESLQARQKSLAAQTSAATLTLNIVGTAAVVVEPDTEPPGFLNGLKSGWNALVGTTKVVLTLIGILLPWLVVLAVLWPAFLAVRRRVRPRTTAKEAAPDAPAGPGEQEPHRPEVTPQPATAGARGSTATETTVTKPEGVPPM